MSISGERPSIPSKPITPDGHVPGQQNPQKQISEIEQDVNVIQQAVSSAQKTLESVNASLGEHQVKLGGGGASIKIIEKLLSDSSAEMLNLEKNKNFLQTIKRFSSTDVRSFLAMTVKKMSVLAEKVIVLQEASRTIRVIETADQLLTTRIAALHQFQNIIPEARPQLLNTIKKMRALCADLKLLGSAQRHENELFRLEEKSNFGRTPLKIMQGSDQAVKDEQGKVVLGSMKANAKPQHLPVDSVAPSDPNILSSIEELDRFLDSLNDHFQSSKEKTEFIRFFKETYLSKDSVGPLDLQKNSIGQLVLLLHKVVNANMRSRLYEEASNHLAGINNQQVKIFLTDMLPRLLKNQNADSVANRFFLALKQSPLMESAEKCWWLVDSIILLSSGNKDNEELGMEQLLSLTTEDESLWEDTHIDHFKHLGYSLLDNLARLRLGTLDERKEIISECLLKFKEEINADRQFVVDEFNRLAADFAVEKEFPATENIVERAHELLPKLEHLSPRMKELIPSERIDSLRKKLSDVATPKVYLSLAARCDAKTQLPKRVGYLQKADELGDFSATFELAKIYRSGRYGVPQDFKKAINLFGKIIKGGSEAAPDSYEQAFKQLTKMETFRYRTVITPEYEEEFLEILANNNDSTNAMLQLSFLFRNQGNEVEAKHWEDKFKQMCANELTSEIEAIGGRLLSRIENLPWIEAKYLEADRNRAQAMQLQLNELTGSLQMDPLQYDVKQSEKLIHFSGVCLGIRTDFIWRLQELIKGDPERDYETHLKEAAAKYQTGPGVTSVALQALYTAAKCCSSVVDFQPQVHLVGEKKLNKVITTISETFQKVVMDYPERTAPVENYKAQSEVFRAIGKRQMTLECLVGLGDIDEKNYLQIWVDEAPDGEYSLNMLTDVGPHGMALMKKEGQIYIADPGVALIICPKQNTGEMIHKYLCEFWGLSSHDLDIRGVEDIVPAA